MLGISIPVGVLIAAVVFVLGARHVSLVASGLYAITLLLVFASVVAAITQRGCSQAVWSGCAIFAAGYFSLAFFEPGFWRLAAGIVGVGTAPVSSNVITSFWFAWLYDRVGAPEIWTGGGTRVPAIHLLYVSPHQIPPSLDISDLNAFVQTGHCIATWTMGAIGAVVGALFHGLRPTTELAKPISAEQ